MAIITGSAVIISLLIGALVKLGLGLVIIQKAGIYLAIGAGMIIGIILLKSLLGR